MACGAWRLLSVGGAVGAARRGRRALDAEARRRAAGFRGADVGPAGGEGVFEVGQPHAAVIARAVRRLLVKAARLARPPVSRGIDRRADVAVDLGAGDADVAVVE